MDHKHDMIPLAPTLRQLTDLLERWCGILVETPDPLDFADRTAALRDETIALLSLRRTVPARPLRWQSSWRALSGKRDPLRELWSEVVRTRDNFTCELRVKCDGRSKADGFKVEAMHVLGAGAYPQIKYLSRNGLTGCVLCHRWLDEHKGSDGQEVLRSVLGDTLDWLFLQAKITHKPDRKMAEIVLRAELRELQAAQGVRE